MKNFKCFYLLIYLLSLSFLTVFVGCGDDSSDPPPVINQPPDLSGLIDVTLSPGFETHEIDFANFVTDQEGDIITYEVTNSNDDVITISLSGTVLTITEVGPGTSDVTVNATDGNVSKAARMLDLGREALRYRINKYDIQRTIRISG